MLGVAALRHGARVPGVADVAEHAYLVGVRSWSCGGSWGVGCFRLIAPGAPSFVCMKASVCMKRRGYARDFPVTNVTRACDVDLFGKMR